MTADCETMAAPVGEYDITRRFRRLVEYLGAQRGNARGWKQQVAEAIGVHPSHLSKVMAGEREIGWSTAQQAADRLGLDLRYFLDLWDQEPDPQHFFSRIEKHGIPHEHDRGVTLGELEGLTYAIATRVATRQHVPQRQWDELVEAALNLEIVRLAEAAKDLGGREYMALFLELLNQFEMLRKGQPSNIPSDNPAANSNLTEELSANSTPAPVLKLPASSQEIRPHPKGTRKRSRRDTS